MILASASPRRKELLSSLTSNFQIIAPKIDESQYAIEELSLLKAKAIADIYPNEYILAADTLVLFQKQILGKPKDAEDAKRMLRLLSNQTHQVSTFYTLYHRNNHIAITRQVLSEVTFHALDEECIEAYVASKSPLDKAGAYGIQDESFHLVQKFTGSYANIMGLPIEEIKKDCISLGIPL